MRADVHAMGQYSHQALGGTYFTNPPTCVCVEGREKNEGWNHRLPADRSLSTWAGESGVIAKHERARKGSHCAKLVHDRKFVRVVHGAGVDEGRGERRLSRS